jgi:hypothetical protein
LKSPAFVRSAGLFIAWSEDQRIAAFGSSYRGSAIFMQELPKAAIF